MLKIKKRGIAVFAAVCMLVQLFTASPMVSFAEEAPLPNSVVSPGNGVLGAIDKVTYNGKEYSIGDTSSEFGGREFFAYSIAAAQFQERKYIYVSFRDAGIAVWDVTDPENPNQIQEFFLTNLNCPRYETNRQMLVKDGYLIMCNNNWYEGLFFIPIDAATGKLKMERKPDNQSELDFSSVVQIYTGQNYNSLRLVGDKLFALNTDNTTVNVIDVSNVAEPNLIGSFNFKTLQGDEGIHTFNNVASYDVEELDNGQYRLYLVSNANDGNTAGTTILTVTVSNNSVTAVSEYDEANEKYGAIQTISIVRPNVAVYGAWNTQNMTVDTTDDVKTPVITQAGEWAQNMVLNPVIPLTDTVFAGVHNGDRINIFEYKAGDSNPAKTGDVYIDTDRDMQTADAVMLDDGSIYMTGRNAIQFANLKTTVSVGEMTDDGITFIVNGSKAGDSITFAYGTLKQDISNVKDGLYTLSVEGLEPGQEYEAGIILTRDGSPLVTDGKTVKNEVQEEEIPEIPTVDLPSYVVEGTGILGGAWEFEYDFGNGSKKYKIGDNNTWTTDGGWDELFASSIAAYHTKDGKDIAYVALRHNGIVVYDITDAENPKQLQEFLLTGFAPQKYDGGSQLIAHNGYLFISNEVTGNNNRIDVVKINDDGTLPLVKNDSGSVDGIYASVSDNWTNHASFKVVGDTLVAYQATSKALSFYDISEEAMEAIEESKELTEMYRYNFNIEYLTEVMAFALEETEDGYIAYIGCKTDQDGGDRANKRNIIVYKLTVNGDEVTAEEKYNQEMTDGSNFHNAQVVAPGKAVFVAYGSALNVWLDATDLDNVKNNGKWGSGTMQEAYPISDNYFVAFESNGWGRVNAGFYTVDGSNMSYKTVEKYFNATGQYGGEMTILAGDPETYQAAITGDKIVTAGRHGIFIIGLERTSVKADGLVTEDGTVKVSFTVEGAKDGDSVEITYGDQTVTLDSELNGTHTYPVISWEGDEEYLTRIVLTRNGSELLDDELTVTYNNDGDVYKLTELNVNKEENKVTVKANIPEDASDNVAVICAVYDNNGKLSTAKLNTTLNAGEQSVDFEFNSLEDVKVKAFIWNMSNIKPLADALEE